MADLQNTVPGAAVSTTHHEVHSTSGYGMLKGPKKEPPVSNFKINWIKNWVKN